jgi:hypothetical protein
LLDVLSALADNGNEGAALMVNHLAESVALGAEAMRIGVFNVLAELADVSGFEGEN